MSHSIQLKLLTLLNVSATKRPLSLDLPGGQKQSSSSREGSAVVENGSHSTGTVNGNGTGSGEEALSGEAEDAEPAAKKQKKKGVVFGGEIGPSGKTALNGNGKKINGSENNKKKGKNGKDGKKNDDAAMEAEEVDEPVGKGRKTNGDGVAEAASASDGADGEDLDMEAEAEAESDSDSDSEDENQASTSKLPSEGHQRRRIQHLGQAGGSTYLHGLGRVGEVGPAGEGGAGDGVGGDWITPSLLPSLPTLPPASQPAFASALSLLSSYKDLYATNLDGAAVGGGSGGSGSGEAGAGGVGGFGKDVEGLRRAGVLHGVNHILKTRRRIIRNNEKLAHSQATNTPLPATFDPRDQSFTRPRVLFLLPFRSMALHYVENHLIPLAPEGTQIENRKAFVSSFSLPENVTDPLADPTKASQYPSDHLQTFLGNSDDNFRFGIKFTRKAWRIVLPPLSEEKLIGCDIIVASPLGLRMGVDKDGGSVDGLSSLEVVVGDGLDVMGMQNWEHVQFVFQNLNKIPNSPHGCDFSRVKPWYIENQAKYLRQTLLISRYDTPEFRSLFNHLLFNVAGKYRVEASASALAVGRSNAGGPGGGGGGGDGGYEGVLGRVRSGVKQVFVRLEGDGGVEELDVRFKRFMEDIIPSLLRSAVSRTNTLIVIPSYFDFVRVTNALRKMQDKDGGEGVSFAAISEYSSNQEISAARTGFFKGKKAFLIVTERFHFYRRYRLRGAKTLIFYSLPDHAHFYSEFLSFPFLPSTATGKDTLDVDEEDVTARVLFSKYDWMKLERVVGTGNARRMVRGEEGRFTFV